MVTITEARLALQYTNCILALVYSSLPLLSTGPAQPQCSVRRSTPRACNYVLLLVSFLQGANVVLILNEKSLSLSGVQIVNSLCLGIGCLVVAMAKDPRLA